MLKALDNFEVTSPENILPGEMFLVDVAFHKRFLAMAITSHQDPDAHTAWLIGVIWPEWNNDFKEISYQKHHEIYRAV
jgi:hypothetical protein